MTIRRYNDHNRKSQKVATKKRWKNDCNKIQSGYKQMIKKDIQEIQKDEKDRRQKMSIKRYKTNHKRYKCLERDLKQQRIDLTEVWCFLGSTFHLTIYLPECGYISEN